MKKIKEKNVPQVTWWQRSKEPLMALAGFIVLCYEMGFEDQPRAIIIGVAIALLGLPTNFFFDKKIVKSHKEGEIVK